MRIVTFILSFYIFGLSTVQCADVICDANESHLSELSTDNHNHQDSENTEDDCSPFCSCTCCQVQINVFNPFLISSENDSFVIVSHLNTYNLSYAGQFLEAPYHPPKSLV